jgi:hypothetical protein
MSQGDLFRTPPPRAAELRPRLHHDVETSAKQERRLAPNFGGNARRILTFLESRPRSGPERGATRAEISNTLDIPIQTVCPAVFALRKGAYVLELDGKKGREKLERGGGNVLVPMPGGAR